MPGLPDGWTFSAEVTGPGGPCSVVIPAGGPGVSRVLTSVAARLVNNSAAGMLMGLLVLDGATQMYSWVLLAPPGASDDVGFDGALVGSPATAMTVRLNVAAIAGQFQDLRIGGYDL